NAAGSLIHTTSGAATATSKAWKAGDIITTAQKLKLAPYQKYPRVASAARKIPFLGPILTSAMAIQLLHSDASHDEKVIGLGGLIFGTAGSIGAGMLGAKIGGAIGSAFPVAGTIIGAILGGFGGYYGGEWVGEKAAQWFLGKEGDDIGKMPAESLHQGNISALNVRKEEVLAAQQGLSPGSPEFLANQETLGYIDQALAFETGSLDAISAAPKIAYDTPGKMQQYMAEYKQSVTSTGTKWTDKMNQDAYNYAVNQISADQNTNTNVNYYDGSMGVHQRDMPTNILNSALVGDVIYSW
ncbi:MAG: hypothetical protein QF535_14495, partial [Anaerolineales bacterium]|nr:hypothetical protein [Anaerolineales bacterium]